MVSAAYEWLALRLLRIRRARPGGLLLFRVTRHRGAAFTLRDGTTVRPADPILELHLSNVALRRLRGRGTWALAAAVRADLGELRRRVAAAELEAVAFRGTSLLSAAGPRFGFELRPLPPRRRNELLRILLAAVDAVHPPSGLSRLRGRPAARRPAEIWLGAGQPALTSRDRAASSTASTRGSSTR